MKETSFIEQNREKWERFEKLRKDGNSDPDDLSKLFVEITDDLSYARTFYPRRSVRVYLNNLAQSVFNSLYKLKKDPFGNFIRFWKIGLPVEMYRARKALYASILVFSISIFIGSISTFDDIDFTRIILGDDYVDMTDTFIESGDPMAVYKQQDEFPMFVRLFFNNIRVAFLTFVMGLLFCAGTGFILVSNGIMLGTFHTYFYLKELALGKGLFLTSLLTVWIHGTFEILAIVLSGAAGFVAGMSLLNPGNYTRMQSFQIGIKRGLKIMMGVTPFIFFAAVLEGYVTRHTEMPDATKLAIIVLSAAIFIFYFMIYPFIAVRKFKDQIGAPPEPSFRPARNVELYKLKQANEIVADAFILFRGAYRTIGKYLWGIIFPMHLILAYFMFLDNSENMNYYNLNFFEFIDNMLTGNKDIVYFLLVSALFSTSLILPVSFLRQYNVKEIKPNNGISFVQFVVRTLASFPFMALLLSIVFFKTDFAFILFLTAAPLVILLPAVINLSDKKGFAKLKYGFSSFFSQIGNAYGLFLIIFVILWGIFALIHSGVLAIIREMIEWHTITQIDDFNLFINFVLTAIYIIFLHHFFIFLSLVFGIFHFVNVETEESVSLFRKVENFGKSSKTHERSVNDEL